MRVERLTLSEWESALPDSGFEVFHLPAALETLDEHAPGDLRLFGGFKGDRPVGLLAAFVRRRTVGSAVVSPPPGFGVPALGPLVMPASPKVRKRESVNRTFADEVLSELAVGSPRTLVRMVCSPTYPDPRPFMWEGLDVEPAFTYVLDVGEQSPDEVLSGFSKGLRREIRNGRDLEVDVAVEGLSAARQVFEDTRDRYREQSEDFPLEWPYVRDLVDALGDRARTYVARGPGGDFLGGITVLYSNDAAYFWQGGAKASFDGVSVNSLLHWAIVEDVATAPPVPSVTKYDLVGANTQRLCRYKAKFGADLVPYHVVESSQPWMGAVKKAYEFVK